MSDQHKIHPGVAAVLSFVFNGLGQFYNGQIFKGLVIMSFSVFGMLILIIGAILIGFYLTGKSLFAAQIILGISLFLAGLFFVCVIGIYSIVDAYQTALKK
ncbi:MAG: hypothetical protein ACM3IL_01465 [Deltaproteobacteria bacterium]